MTMKEIKNLKEDPPANPEDSDMLQGAVPCLIELTGEKGFRTAICTHGCKYGDFYFEVEMLSHKIPTPFLDVTPAVRVGFTNFGL